MIVEYIASQSSVVFGIHAVLIMTQSYSMTEDTQFLGFMFSQVVQRH